MFKPRDSRQPLPLAVGAVIVFVVALGTIAPAGALATGGAGASSACSNATVKVSFPPGNLTLRVVRVGSVSCGKAQRLTRAYFHKAIGGKRCEGTRCIIVFSGGWSCSYFSVGESEETGGAIAGCFQEATRARVRLYKILGGKGFLSPDKKIWCQTGELKPGVPEVGCVTSGVTPGRGGIVKRGGQVTLCTEDPAPFGFRSWRCYQNFLGEAPVLAIGERVEAAGFRCTSATNGITCTVLAGGKGFRINQNEVVEVQPSSAEAASVPLSTAVDAGNGVAGVDDFPHHRTVLVSAPNSILVRPGAGG
jgi:hypothetical protein